ncbi:MAG: recombination regulator RecX [Betaproteobacteria bacterium]|nr:recombination regulator RecX [Betaproteobacteria bacterium]
MKDSSLIQRGLAALARREYSAAELKRKLAAHAASDEALEEALKALKDRGYLSEARFAESFIRRQAARKGTSFIKQSLKQHQLSAELIATVTTDLQASEESRARQLWERRFGEVAVDPKERLRQMRFLASRGFSHDVIRRITRED